MKKVNLALAEPPIEERPATERVAARVLSVIVSVLTDVERAVITFQHYHAALADQGFELEFVYVLDRKAHRTRAGLEMLKAAGAPLQMIVLSRWDGEISALKSGLRHARGATCLLLPAAAQIDDGALPKLVHALDDGCDMVVGTREPHQPSWFMRLQSNVFHALIRALFGRAFSDLGCRVRVCRRQVLEEILGLTTQHQFLALLATERGFEVREVPLKATTAQANPLRLVARLRLALDAVALYLVLNYIYKPFRFFGAIGLPILALGALYTGILMVERIWFGVALADRPALILAVLLIVLGIQVVVLGLIGEIIVFASGRRIKDYTVDRIL